jgi:hypothetical protein
MERKSPHSMRPDQEQIAEWIGRQSTTLHDAYVIAVQSLADTAFPGRAQFICHSGRDICTGLQDIRGIAKRKHANTTAVFQEVEPQWIAEGLDRVETVEGEAQANEPTGAADSDVKISRHMFRLLQRLVEEHRLGSVNQEEQAAELFAAIAPESAERPELVLPMAREWVSLRRWFHNYAHFAVQQKTPPEEELQSQFAKLESYVLASMRTFYEGMEGLDEILGEANS